MSATRFDPEPAKDFLAEAVKLIASRAKESPLRHNLSTHLGRMFPDMPWWVRDHATRAETNSAFYKNGAQANGFVDTLVGATAVEYEKDLTDTTVFATGLGQVKDYCADLVNKGVPVELIVGVLSDTVRWHAFRVADVAAISEVPGATSYGRAHITLDLIDHCDLSAAGEAEAQELGQFLIRHFGRVGARRLDARTLANDLGFESSFSAPHRAAARSLVDSAFVNNASYAELIQKLWRDFISYLGGDGADGFNKDTYASEVYLLTLAKLICANVLMAKALRSADPELCEILDGTFFQNRGLSNLVEYDYFGWLNAAPHVGALLPIARAIQGDLAAYDFASPPAEDLFGALMAQLATRSQRLMLGQEWTPPWLAEKLVANTIAKLPCQQDPMFVDMCCGSGAMVVETVKQTKARLVSRGMTFESPSALTVLSEAITGFDIDPLAVLLAKVSWVLAARDWLDPARPVSIPVYHADSLFAATPLTRLMDDDGVAHHGLLLDDQEVALPAFLISPERQRLFDALLDVAYAVAMASAQSPASTISTAVVEQVVCQAERSSEGALADEERKLATQFCSALINALESLQRAGRNGIWSFILRNSYRPGLLRGRFNGLVSNPPWLALSKIAENPYTGALRNKASDYAIKPPGPSHLHVEMATIFLLHAVERYLAPDASIGCILPATLTNAHHQEPFRAAAYANAKRPVRMRIDEIWRVATGTFKNEAVIIFCTKAQPGATESIPGAIVSKSATNPLTFKRILRGTRSAFSENDALGANGSGFFQPADFRQGADVMPRSLIFHALTRSGASSWDVAPVTVTSPERYLRSDAKVHREFSVTAHGVSDSVVFDVLLSHHLTPFDIGAGAKGVLPIVREDGTWRALTATEVALKGKPTENVLNKILEPLGPSATPRTLLERMEADRKKLTNQSWDQGWFVFMGAGGSNVCAAYAPTAAYLAGKTIIDQTLYWTIVASEYEAAYLTGLLNSTAINDVIRQFQPIGQFGERHIHKLPVGVTPPFDPSEPIHQSVAQLTLAVQGEWKEHKQTNGSSLALLNPNSSNLQTRRRRIRAILATLPSWKALEDACKVIYCVD